ncbi:MAG: hypothetical protein WDN48_11940 [Pseudolabrys sp.]
MTDITLPPLCPECSGAMTLKQVLRDPTHAGFVYFFRCTVCDLEYPRPSDKKPEAFRPLPEKGEAAEDAN